MTGLLHLTEEDKSIKSTKSLSEKPLGKVGCSMWKWQGVESWDVIGPLYMPIRMLWMIWNIAEPQTTKMKSAKSHGPTDTFSSLTVLVDLTLPLWVMFLLCFSLAMRILCLATIVAKCWCVVKSELVTVTNMTNTTQTTSEDEEKTTSIFVYVLRI